MWMNTYLSILHGFPICNKKRDFGVNVVRIHLIYIALFAIGISRPVLSYSASSYGEYADNLESIYSDFSKDEKVEFHKNLLGVMERGTKANIFKEKKFKVYTTYRDYKFIDLFISNAVASLDDPTVYCNFGGWITSVESSKCLTPWTRSVRNDPELEIFGSSYRHSCGGANLFRCNPVVFGPAEEGKGFCVTTDDSDPNLSTTSCIEEFNRDPKASENLIDYLADNPKDLASYLAIAAETIRSCDVQEDPFSYCRDLISTMEYVSTAAVKCSEQTELISFLPMIMTPFNEDELDRITDGLGTRAKEYAEQLEEEQEAIRANNRKVLEDAIAAAQSDPRLVDTLKRARDNATDCLRNLCNGSGYRNSKPATKSIAKCAAYVKHAFFPYPSEQGKRFANFSEYPWDRKSDDAVESSGWLKRNGFVNVLDYPELSHLTPENAPVGAIIVYEKQRSSRKTMVDGVRRGAPGHIEFKASDNEYISDFINDEPTRVGGARTPIGIYFKLPKEYTDQLKEVPEL